MDHQANSRLNLGMSVDRFLSGFWQQRPLLAPGALPEWRSPITPDELAGLACEDSVESRIVRGPDAADDWHLEFGPFDPERFGSLPEQDWTLLVQDLEKLLPGVDRLLDAFRFLPAWRIDDVMGSYAVAGGSVGPHWDHYDVFLVQAIGRRRWEIDAGAAPSLRYRPEQELKLLQTFEPTESWVATPGDVLYLPPGVPHHGVALDECLTFSVGMRAPSHAEMLVDFAATVAEKLPEDARFSDPRRTPPDHPARLQSSDIEQAIATIRRLVDCPDDELSDWFGSFVTRYRLAAEPDEQDWDRGAVERLLDTEAVLQADPWSRRAFIEEQEAATLFVNGQAFATSRELARLLSRGKIETGEIPRTAAARQLIQRLLRKGFLTVSQ